MIAGDKKRKSFFMIPPSEELFAIIADIAVFCYAIAAAQPP